jgi:protein-tyrosine phosphatase
VLDVIDHWRGDPDEAALVTDAGLAYLNNPTADDWTVKPVEWFQASLDFAMPALQNPKARIYAHCREGISRGPSTALAILLAQGMGYDEALALIYRKRLDSRVTYRVEAREAVAKLDAARPTAT